MRAERENGLVDLLDKLLNKGLVLNADLIISVAGVPLIGVSLKAALAGIETMLEYGMMEAWDQQIREWYLKELRKKAIPLTEGEHVILRTFGSFLDERWINPTWSPGFWFLTNKRLFLFRNDPPKVLLEIPLNQLESLTIAKGMHYRKEREELYVQFNCGKVVRIHVPNVKELKNAIEKTTGRKLERHISEEEIRECLRTDDAIKLTLR